MFWYFEQIILALGVLGSSVWIYAYYQAWRRPGVLLALRDQPSDMPSDGWPGLAVIFAARDEAEHVARATRLLLAQDYPALRLIAVDDRSRDDTGIILDAIAAEDSRLRVVHIRELHDGWLGKCNALQRGADEAGDIAWLLFTDADVMFAPGSLRRAIAFAVKNGLDHLTLTPDIPTEGFIERVFMTEFVLSFSVFTPQWRIADPSKKAAMGVGAFNLVRTEAFHAVGGFRNIRLSVDDDMRLGQALKFAGYRNNCLSGRDDVKVRWHVGARKMIVGLEKNFFAALDFRIAIIPLAVIGVITHSMLPYVALILGPWWVKLIAAVGIASARGLIALTKRQSNLAWYHALFMPLGGLLILIALIRSTFLTLRRGGVSWRGHLYPLKMLKEHVRIRNRWLNELWRSTR